MRKIKKIVALVATLALCLGLGTNVSATEGSELLFAGGSNVAYESEDVSWLMDAEDDDVITLVYTCTDSTHAGWGVLGWGATVDGVWTDGPSHAADATDAGASVYATMTVKELKTALGIKDNSEVTLIKLGAWNGGKIEGLYISAPDAVPTKEEAKDVDASEITTEDSKKAALPELTGDFLYMFNEPTSFKIYPNAFNSAFIPFRTITLTVVMESNADFGGCLGTCVNNWVWSMPTFVSDENNQATVTWYLTPWLDNIEFQIWWMSGSQLGIKSITVDTDIDWHALYAQNLLASGGVSGGTTIPSAPTREPYEGNVNAAHSGYMDLTTTEDWTNNPIALGDLIGNVDPATITSIVFNGDAAFQIGYNTVAGWTQHEGTTNYTISDIDYSANYYAHIGIGRVLNKRITWDVYTNGATPGGNDSADDETQTPTTPDYAAIAATAGKDLFNTAASWKTAISLKSSEIPASVDNTYIVVKQTGATSTKLGINSGASWENWNEVTPDYEENGVSIFSYDTIKNTVSDFSLIQQIGVMNTTNDSFMKVTSLQQVVSTDTDYTVIAALTGAKDYAVASGGAWSMAYEIKTDNLNASSLTEKDYLVINYTGSKPALKVITSSYGWDHVNPVYEAEGVTVYDQASIAAASDLSTNKGMIVANGTDNGTTTVTGINLVTVE